MNNLKYVKTYESFAGDIARYNPKRLKNDRKVVDLLQEIYDDFEKYGKDLKKVNIITDDNKKVDFSKIKVGKYYKLSYIFGKFHPTYNNIFTGNKRAGNRKITITDIPFSITLHKNELEKFFNTSRVTMRRTHVEEEKIINNPNYNPNSDRQGERHKYDVIEDRYRISYDMAIKLFKYFVNEYELQYPDLKDSNYKSSMTISDIEKGVPPTLRYIHPKTKDGEEITVSIKKGDDEKEVRKMVSNMTKEEYDQYYKERNKRLYKPHEEKMKKKRKEWEKKINNLLEKNKIDLSEYKSKWEEFGFRLRFYSHKIIIEFRSTDKDIKTKLDKFAEEDFGDYEISLKRAKESYKFEEDGLYFITIILETDDY